MDVNKHRNTGKGEPEFPQGNGAPGRSRYEAVLSSPITRRLLQSWTERNGNGTCALENIFRTYANPEANFAERLRYFLPHRMIDLFASFNKADKETLRHRVLGHRPTARTLINTARSIGTYGLTKPQRFAAPIIVVWNITQACNLACRHCYQDASRRLPDELTQQEQLDIIDQLSENYVGMLAFAGGEPLISREFWETCRYAVQRHLHVTVATNGTLLTEANVTRLREIGVKIIEISLDSTRPEKHNAFRGKGMWEKTVQGIRNAIAQSDGRNYRVSVASTITRMNFAELEDLIRFSADLGAHTFNAFNFIPTGRGRKIMEDDLTPREREEMLEILTRHMNEDRITVLSTAPQMGRVCLESGMGETARITIGHGGSARGKEVQLYTEYIGGCGTGRCYCAIQPNGLVTPCVFMPKVVGDLRRQKFMEIWKNSESFLALCDRNDRTDHCQVCTYKFKCGGCRARAFNYTGDFRAGDPGCIYNLKQWEELVQESQEHPPEIVEPLAAPSGKAGPGPGPFSRQGAEPTTY